MVSKPYRIVSGVVIFVVFLAIWYPAAIYDDRLTDAWHNSPVVRIAELHSGELVKIEGALQSNHPVAWGGHEVYYSRSGWGWVWNSTDTFEVTDGFGTVLVTTEAWYIIYNGPWYAPYAQHTSMTMYLSGDLVQIVGTVGTLANGVLHVEAQIMSALSAVHLISLAPSAVTVFLLYAIPATIAVVGVSCALLFSSRRRAHGRAIQGHLAVPITLVDEVRDPSLVWQRNGRGTAPGRRFLWASVFAAGGAVLLALFPGYAPRPETGYFGLGLLGSVVIVFDAFIIYLLLFGGVGHPSSVALATDGFHMWYDSAYDRHLNETVFPWGQIRNIHMTSGKGAHWVLTWTTGEATNLYMLTGRNISLLLNEWAKRATPGTG